MAALTTSGAEAAAAAVTATAPVATAVGAEEIDFAAEAQARGMTLVSSTKVSLLVALNTALLL